MIEAEEDQILQLIQDKFWLTDNFFNLDVVDGELLFTMHIDNRYRNFALKVTEYD